MTVGNGSRAASLHGAKLRTERAAQHNLELERAIAAFDRESIRITVDKAAFERGEVLAPIVDWSAARRPPTSWIAILAGESIYNLRAALDYLIFALAILDSGNAQPDTQFPIADTPSAWSTQRQRRLKGIDAHHRDELERYQPFRGCGWTPRLRELSNPDKHQTLTAVYVQFEGAMRADRESARPVPGQADRLNIAWPGQAMSFHFWNDDPVVETLNRLATEVAKALKAFQEDFGESDVLTLG